MAKVLPFATPSGSVLDRPSREDLPAHGAQSAWWLGERPLGPRRVATLCWWCICQALWADGARRVERGAVSAVQEVHVRRRYGTIAWITPTTTRERSTSP